MTEHARERAPMYYVDPVIKTFHRTYQPEGRLPYIRLDQNENPDGVPRWLFDEAMARVTPEYLAMYPEEGVLTEKYAAFLGLKRENVTLVDGSVVGMGYIIKVFGEPGKDLVCVNPTFGMYGVFADMVGMNKVSVPYNDDFSFDIGKTLNLICESTGIVVLVNPNMPIGNAYTQDEMELVIEKAKEYSALVVIDEAYYYFHESQSIDFLSHYDNVVILRTFSKMFSLAGLRMGSIISTAENVRYINNYKPHYTVNCVALAFGEAIVDNHDRLVKELSEKFFTGKAYLFDALDNASYSYLDTEGCFICIWPKHRTAEYITEALKERGILIFCGKGGSEGMLRVTIWDKRYMEMFMNALLEIDVE